MAIRFARREYVRRSQAQSTVRIASYIAKRELTAERTGRTYPENGPWHGPEPALIENRLPDGADPRYFDLAALWNEAERSHRRKDAVVATHTVLSLPNNKEISDGQRIEMARQFVDREFVSKGIPVTLAIHFDPHNKHAHVLGTTRTLDGDSFSQRKAPDNTVRWVNGRPLVVKGEAWGQLWSDFQNDYFRKNGVAVRVDPLLPVHRKHLGPRRFQDPRSPTLQEDARIREVNRTIQARQQRQATVTRTPASNPVAGERREGRARIAPADPSHPRIDRKPAARPQPLTIEAIARTMSPEYARLRDQARQQQALVYRTKGGRQKLADKISEDTARLEQRHIQLGQARLLLHRIGRWAEEKKREVRRKYRGPWRVLAALQHPETKAIEDQRTARQLVHDQRWSIDLKTALDRLTNLNRRADAFLEQLRPAAEAELQRRRQQIAEQRLPEAVQQQTPRHRLKM